MTERIDPKISLERFAEKLASLRVSMNRLEQSLLDEMVSNSEFDVVAHDASVSLRAVPASAAVINFKAAAAKADEDIEDVAAHALSEGRVSESRLSESRISFKIAFNDHVGYQVFEEDDDDGDVVAHRMNQ